MHDLAVLDPASRPVPIHGAQSGPEAISLRSCKVRRS